MVRDSDCLQGKWCSVSPKTRVHTQTQTSLWFWRSRTLKRRILIIRFKPSSLLFWYASPPFIFCDFWVCFWVVCVHVCVAGLVLRKQASVQVCLIHMTDVSFPSATLSKHSTVSRAILPKTFHQEQTAWVDRGRKCVTCTELKNVTTTTQPVAHLCSRKVYA